jgi:uncharacterized protein
VFITETGYVSDKEFYTPAFKEVWTDSTIVAITPFILFAGNGDFLKFSLLDSNHLPKKTYLDIFNLAKVSGSPLLSNITARPLSGFVTDDQPEKSKPSVLQNLLNLFKLKRPTLKINNVQIEIEVADTPKKREQGLSGRASLADNSGVLFKFETVGKHSFWMKDMKFALDFIWIRDGKIVEITQNVPPPSETGGQPQVVNPTVEIDSVLEVNAGVAEKYNWNVGDAVINSD